MFEFVIIISSSSKNVLAFFERFHWSVGKNILEILQKTCHNYYKLEVLHYQVICALSWCSGNYRQKQNLSKQNIRSIQLELLYRFFH